MTQLPPETLRTARCLLRPWRIEDAPELYRAVQNSEEHLSRWVGVAKSHTSESASIEEIRTITSHWWANTNFVLGIFSLEDGRVLGGTGFHPRNGALGENTTEIGMWICKDEAGQGLGQEVLVAVLEWAFTAWWWERIEWRCDPRNLASCAVAERANLTLEGVLRSNTVDQAGNRCDTAIFAALRGVR